MSSLFSVIIDTLVCAALVSGITRSQLGGQCRGGGTLHPWRHWLVMAGASIAPLTHLSAGRSPEPQSAPASQLQLSALARRNNCFARGEMCGPAR